MKIEKKSKFFYVSIAFAAQKLVVTAQIEKKWILPLLSIIANSLQMYWSNLTCYLFLVKKYQKFTFFQLAVTFRVIGRFL